MRKYTLTIEGDFEKGECGKCPLAYDESSKRFCKGTCILWWQVDMTGDCPLEEVGDE